MSSGQDFSTSVLQAQMGFAIVATIGSAIGMTAILMRIEKSRVVNAISSDPNSCSTEDGVAANGGNYRVENDLELEGADEIDITDAASTTAKYVGRRLKRFDWVSLVIPVATTGVLVLLVYLLLVFLPAGLWLSLLGLVAVMGIVLRTHIYEELRRQRADRLSALVTLLLLTAAFLSLATFASKSLAEGEIYRGRARIVGYDENSYENKKDGTVTRTDLEVAWGGSWGCPRDADKQCQAFVNGALCEVDADEGTRRLQRKRRVLSSLSGNKDDKDKTIEQQSEEITEDEEEIDQDEDVIDEQDEEIDELVDEVEEIDEDYVDQEIENEELEEVIDEGDNVAAEEVEEYVEVEEEENEEINSLETENEELEEDLEDEETENQELQEEKGSSKGATQEQVDEEEAVVEEEEEEITELEDENQDLEDEVVEEEEEVEEVDTENEELENELNEEEGGDDFVIDEELVGEVVLWDDDYWDYDWESVWGDYACEDLFETDLEGIEYDAQYPPGRDDWPFVYIYGSCNTCEAYLVDYYSTEHFQGIHSYQRLAANYALAALAAFVATCVFLVKQRLNPSQDNEIELLSYDGRGGALA